ncbi:ACT domain-containing protein [Pseudalkalibacillus caeni]|uniref:UPF0735 ACT domain-containing protein FCL54_02810 n=1 Tax=Exobacillus caeni TaxID=2574798 RepID=A0A5R9FF83_9BACL|nr:ACT domain-containing protein [Pseudalkalibacillus caeni]TLS39254.1 ACT domain-containing protein [Pseudalkalibacillus caeni]
MKKKEKKYYLVREDVLSESMQKTLQAKELLESGKAESVFDAVKQVDLSRSAFYKYRDGILPFHTMIIEQIITLYIKLEDRSGVLSEVLKTVAEIGCNVLTINQTIPLQGKATVILTVETGELQVEVNSLLEKIRKVNSVHQVEIIGSGA